MHLCSESHVWFHILPIIFKSGDLICAPKAKITSISLQFETHKFTYLQTNLQQPIRTNVVSFSGHTICGHYKNGVGPQSINFAKLDPDHIVNFDINVSEHQRWLYELRVFFMAYLALYALIIVVICNFGSRKFGSRAVTQMWSDYNCFVFIFW